MKIIAIGHRLADLKIACFNTLSKYANNNNEVSLIIVENTKNWKEKNAVNYIESFKKNGISKIYFVETFDFSKVTQDNVKVLRLIIEKIAPSLAIMPFNRALDKKNKVLAESSMLACRGIGSILMYETNKNRNFVPCVYCVIKEKTSKKISVTVGKKNTDEKVERKTRLLQKSYARRAGMPEPVEAFESHRLISLNNNWF